MKDCTIEELRSIIDGLVARLDHDQMLHNESLIDKRWFRERLKEDTHKFECKERYLKDQIKSIQVELSLAKKMTRNKTRGRHCKNTRGRHCSAPSTLRA